MTPDQAYAQAITDIANLAHETAEGIDAMPASDLHATRRTFAATALRAFADELRTRLLSAGERLRGVPHCEGNPAGPAPEAVARLRGYVGEACPDCANFTLVRNGTCLKCDTCGGTSGCS